MCKLCERSQGSVSGITRVGARLAAPKRLASIQLGEMSAPLRQSCETTSIDHGRAQIWHRDLHEARGGRRSQPDFSGPDPVHTILELHLPKFLLG